MYRHAKAPTVPANTSWTVSLPFRPRNVPDAIKNMLAETLIRNDKGIHQLLRQCKDKWIFAVTMGHDAMYLKIFDPTEVDTGSNRAASSAINRPATSFFEIDRDLNIRQLASERADRVMQTYPMLYTERSLKQSEITMCNSIERSMTSGSDLVVSDEDVTERTKQEFQQICDNAEAGDEPFVEVEPRPEFTLEPTV